MNVYLEGFICDGCEREFDNFSFTHYNADYHYVGDHVVCDDCVDDFNEGVDHLEQHNSNLRGKHDKGGKKRTD